VCLCSSVRTIHCVISNIAIVMAYHIVSISGYLIVRRKRYSVLLFSLSRVSLIMAIPIAVPVVSRVIGRQGEGN